MSRPVAPIVCDGPGCTNRKQESNHWWTVRSPGDGDAIVVFPGTVAVPAAESPSRYFDACGQDCALKIVSEQMSKVTS
jgi:hypothetical protein